MKFAILYTLLALFMFVMGIIKENPVTLIGSIIISGLAFYWIRKEWKKK